MIDNSTYKFPVQPETAMSPQPLVEPQPQPAQPVFERSAPAAYDRYPELSPRYIEAELIEQDIEDMRLAADESALPSDGIMNKMIEGMRRFIENTREDLERRLVDAESYIGGALLPKSDSIISQRFWFHRAKPEEAAQGVNEAALDWFWDIRMSDGTTMHVGYKLLHGVLIKAVNGHPVQLQPGEVDSFYRMVKVYHQAIQAKMYGKHKKPTTKQDKSDIKTFKDQIDHGINEIRAHEVVTELNVDDAMDYIMTAPNPRMALAKKDFRMESDERNTKAAVAESEKIVREAYAAMQAQGSILAQNPAAPVDRIASQAYAPTPMNPAVVEAARIVNEAYAAMRPTTPSYDYSQAQLARDRSQLV